MAADSAGGPLAAVVADEHGRRERVVDALHHLERPRKAADDADVFGQLVDQHVLAVAVRIADDDLGGTGLADAGDRGVDFAGHPLARARVFEPARAELRRLDDAGDAFHVDRNEDLSGPGLCLKA